MRAKLICRICWTSHNNTSKNFPMAMHEKRANKEGKVIDIIVGYICKKCVRKGLREKLKQEYEASRNINLKRA